MLPPLFLSFYTFSFDLCIVCPYNYDFWLIIVISSNFPYKRNERTNDCLLEFQHIFYSVFVLFVFVLCLDCPFLIAPSVFSNVHIETTSNESSPSHLNTILCNYLSIYVELFLVGLLASRTYVLTLIINGHDTDRYNYGSSLLNHYLHSTW